MSQSTNSRKAGRWVQIPLGILLLVLVLNALGGGYYGMAGAKDIPIEWLKGSPFRDYFSRPHTFNFCGRFCVGGCHFSLHKTPAGKKAAFGSCAIVVIWLSVQVAIIGYVSWMQPATAALTVIIFYSPFNFLYMAIKQLLFWLPMIIIAFANATLRELVFIKYYSEMRAHQLSTITLIFLCVIYTGFIFLTCTLKIQNKRF